MQFRLLAVIAAVVVITLFLSPEASTGSRVVGSNIPIAEETEQVIYNRGFLSYDLLVGEFTQETVGGAVRYRPTGEGDHFLEFAWTDAPEDVVSIELSEEGELWRGDHWILIDQQEQGRVEYVQQQPSVMDVRADASWRCDAIIFDVKQVTVTGGCWSGARTNGTVTSWKCNEDNGEGCVATIESGDGDVDEYIWQCDGKSDTDLVVDTDEGTAQVKGADSGPGC